MVEHKHPGFSRRNLLQARAGIGAGLPFLTANAASDKAGRDLSKRILVVLELSGANDGFNTLVPYADDAYYRLRPKIGIRPANLRKIDDQYGFSPGMAGFERLYKEGKMAVVHGCGYAQPSYSHFTSMAYWHTGAPNSGEPYGWLGRLADAIDPTLTSNFLVNIDERQSLAVNAARHVPVVFDDPARFRRKGLHESRPLLDLAGPAGTSGNSASGNAAPGNATQRYLDSVATSAREASQLVRSAGSNYKTPVDYGLVSVDLPKVASLIAADLPTRLYYTAYRHNAFDTHVQQGEVHQRLLTYVSDAVSGFMQDMERIGRADDVTVLVFSEFGRRAAENTSLGTDHGTANHMYVIGKPVKGGHYGKPPSLTDLDANGNVAYTTDFRRVYASLIEGWFGYQESKTLLSGDFQALPIFS